MGGADCSETAPAPGLDNVAADFRNVDGCEDTDTNLANFTTGGPAPRNGVTKGGIAKSGIYFLRLACGGEGLRAESGRHEVMKDRF
jgi:hypothetical protein